jgi:hypothetical protein
MVGEPPSASAATAAQVKIEVTLTPLAGLIDTLVTTGSVLPIVTVVLLVADPPCGSLAVTTQLISSDGDAAEMLRVMVVPTPRVVPVEVLIHS